MIVTLVGIGLKQTWIETQLPLILPNCVILAKSFQLSESQFPHL